LRVVSVWRLRTPFSHEGISCWMTTAGKSPLTALGFSASSALTSPVQQANGVDFAGHAWIGVSVVDDTLEVRSGWQWRYAASNLAGSTA
jgi:hypothetical protein